MCKQLRLWSPHLGDGEHEKLQQMLMSLEGFHKTFLPAQTISHRSQNVHNSPDSLLRGVLYSKTLRNASSMKQTIAKCLVLCFDAQAADGITKAILSNLPSASALQRAQVQVDACMMVYNRTSPALVSARSKYMSDSSPQGHVNWGLTQYYYVDHSGGQSAEQIVTAIWNLVTQRPSSLDCEDPDFAEVLDGLTQRRHMWGRLLLDVMKTHIQVFLFKPCQAVVVSRCQRS